MNAFYFILALAFFMLYAMFMIIKFALRIKVTRAVMTTHILTALAAFISAGFMMKSTFVFNKLSVIGIILALIGIIFIVTAGIKLNEQLINPKKNTLITSGPYKYTRNPIYFGIILLAYAAIFFSFTPEITLYCFLVTAMFFVIIGIEEHELAERLGAKYEKYRKDTPMLFPFVIK